MAITNYTELKAAVEEWIDREGDTEVVDRIPDFIYFGELKTFRRLRIRTSEASAQYTTNTSQGILIPQDLREVKLLRWDGLPLERWSEQKFHAADPDNSTQGTPTAFARTSQTLIEFFPPPDNDATVDVDYYYGQAPISDSFIPPLFTQAPDLYLFGALIEALPFLENAVDGQAWKDKYEEVFNDLQTESEEAEYAGGTVAVGNVYYDGDRYGT